MIFGDFSVPHFRGFMRRAPQSLTLIATVCILGLSIRSAYAITVGSACISGYNGYLAFDNSSPGNLLVCNGTTYTDSRFKVDVQDEVGNTATMTFNLNVETKC